MLSRAVIVGLSWVAFAAAQPPGNPNDPRTRGAAAAQVQAGQVVAELRNLHVQAIRQPQPIQAELHALCATSTTRATNLQRSIATGQPPATLLAEFQALDRGIDQLVARTRAVAGNDVALQSSAARADFATNRIGAALNFGIGLPEGAGPIAPLPGGPLADPQRQNLRRLARSLDGHAETLYRVAKTTLPPDRLGRQLEDDIRQFARSADRLGDRLNSGASIEQARGEFGPVQARWTAVAQALGGIGMSAYPQLRVQAAQVGQSYQLLATALGAGPPPGVPDAPGFLPQPVVPGFAICNHRDQAMIAIGAGEGGVPVVRLLLDRGGATHHDFMAYDAGFQGGVRVAVADITGDGIVDVVTAPGPGGPPLVRVFDGRDLSLVSQFYAYDPRMLSGVWVAAMDITGSGRAEIITGAGDGGGPHVRIFDGLRQRVRAEFFAYDQQLACGARVAVADIDGDRVPDIITAPGPGAEPLVRGFSGRTLAPIAGFYAYDRAFVGGVYLAAADVTGSGRAAVVTGPGANGGPHVRLFDPMQGTAVGELWAYDQSFLGGVRVALFDADRSRQPFLIAAPGPGASPVVRIFAVRSGQLLNEFSAFDPNFVGGAWVAGQ